MRADPWVRPIRRGLRQRYDDHSSIASRERPRTVRRRDAARAVSAVSRALALAAAVVVASALDHRVGSPDRNGSLEPWPVVAWVAMTLGLAFVGSHGRRTRDPTDGLALSVAGATVGMSLVVVAAFSIGYALPRGWVLLTWMAGMAFLLTERLIARTVIRVLHRRGRLRHAVIIVGADAEARSMAHAVGRTDADGFDVAGFVRIDGCEVDPALAGSILGDLWRLPELVRRHRIEEVLLPPNVAAGENLSHVIGALDGLPVRLSLASALDGYLVSRLHVRPLGGVPVVTVERNELRPASRSLKRAFDVTIGGVLLLLFLPLIAMCALAVRLDTRGGAFFGQRRIGIGGRAFTMWKLRTMVEGAESSVGALRAHNTGHGLLFKMRNDPRVTRVGRVLRRWSLDELPQLWNVVAGQMSLVGPRPPLPEEVARYDERIRRRLLVKPGITGLWQVSGRHENSFEDYVRFDVLYVQSWSLALDLSILIRTLPAVLRGRGAY
jgi:exopolysaccharide biosynthesis polyprenyl glycosylphosphotransferase